MKICCITEMPFKHQISGAQTSLTAFAEWYEELEGVRPQILGYATEEEKEQNEIRPEINIMVTPEDITESLMQYDTVVYATVPVLLPYVSGNISVVMIHSEIEEHYFGNENVQKAFENASILFSNSKVRDNKDILMRATLGIRPSLYGITPELNRKTFLTSLTRVSHGKNVLSYLKYANENLHIYEGASLAGPCRSTILSGKIKRLKGSVSWFNRYTSEKSLFRNPLIGFLYDNLYCARQPILTPRLNTVSIEAIARGIIPIVNPRTTPVPVMKNCIDCNLRGDELIGRILEAKAEGTTIEKVYPYEEVKAKYEELFNAIKNF